MWRWRGTEVPRPFEDNRKGASALTAVPSTRAGGKGTGVVELN